MNAVQSVLFTYVLNALWQVPLLFVAALIASLLLRRNRAAVMYRVWVGALVAETLVPAMVTARPLLSHLLEGLAPKRNGDGSSHISVIFGPGTTSGTLHLAPGVLTGISLLYVISLTYAALRLVLGLFRLRRLRNKAVTAPLTTVQQQLWDRCRARFRVRGTQLLHSPDVSTPLTAGILRPYVFLPKGLLEATPARDLEALFSHECAHMQRRDFLGNLLLQLVALPVAFHPLMYRTRAQMAESREWVCDDLAAAAVGTPLRYARSLLRLAAQLLPAEPVVPIHAIGMLDANALERRVMHLTQRNKTASALQRTTTLILCGLLGFATCGSAWAWGTGVFSPASPQSDTNSKTVRLAGGVVAGNRLNVVNPVYPPEAKQQGIEGSVVLNAVISPQGTVEQLNVVSGPEELREAALQAVRQWTYKPFEVDGQPTEVTTTITVNFQLQH